MTPDPNTINPLAIEAWMTTHVAGFSGPVTVRRFMGGQSNPTYRLGTPSHDYVLRRKPMGELLPGAHRVDREFRVLKALENSTVPIPKAYAYCDDLAVIGSAFYVMDCVAGRIFWDQLMPEVDDAARASSFDSMNGTIAALHSIDPKAIGLDTFGHSENYLVRQIRRWSSQYETYGGERVAAMEEIIDWLPQHMPPDGAPRIVHGDYKIDNIVFHAVESRVTGVLDWELATIGDPLADFSYHAMAWYLEPDLFRGFAGALSRAPGIPAVADYVAAYEHRTGARLREHWRFYLVFSMFRLAGILFGIAQRAKTGTAADPDAARVGAQASPVSERAWHIANTTETLL